ncbi:TetR/AcrR family transcriptional regulator [Guptibacillus algicola]|uniref:TetR/AcrR family transcriptional regulator n=1 Tax=Guptibacillus algicola TaxID=225844 RepID=UPI001CD455F1|nr:TetR/AcrR family transcriptional regulator [Alkalihalobacillus algicola]MCA0988365.1 TetR/AcrR family transcriptional regulator [Alkalihalobacillus algicola]
MKHELTVKSIELFEKKGFSETSIQDIVDAIGVTKGTFYYYFKSKEALLMDIHSSYIDNMIKQQKEILEDRSKDCRTKLYDMVYMLIHNIELEGKSARVFFREIKNLKEENLSKILPKRDQIRYYFEDLLKQGVANGEFRNDLNIEIVTFGILGMTNWTYQWYQPDGPVSDKEVAQMFVDMVLNGIEESS